MKIINYMLFLTIIFFNSCGDSNSEKKCSKDNIKGDCNTGMSCLDGECKDNSILCSLENLKGLCPQEELCKEGICTNKADIQLCSDEYPKGYCDEENICIKGECKNKIYSYKLAFIGKKFKLGSSNESKFSIHSSNIDSKTANNITGDFSCPNEFSCWISFDKKYIFSTSGSDNDFNLDMYSINDNNIDISSKMQITKNFKTIHGVKFKKNMITFITKNDDLLKLNLFDINKKENKEVFLSVVIDVAGHPNIIHPNAYEISNDLKYVFYSIAYTDEANSVEIFKKEINSDKKAEIIYSYERESSSGSGIKYSAISYDNSKLVFIETYDNQFNLHMINTDGSSKEDKNNKIDLGNTTCEAITGNQMCRIASKLFFSKDNTKLYWVGGLSKDAIGIANIFEYDISNKKLSNFTKDSILEGQIIYDFYYHSETEHAFYLEKSKNIASNLNIIHIDMKSPTTDPDSNNRKTFDKKMVKTKDRTELKILGLLK